MFIACRDVGGLIDLQRDFLLAVDDAGRAADNNPVFAAVVVHLQAQGRTRFDLNTLDLELRAFFDHCVAAPRAMHRTRLPVGKMALLLERCVYLFDILAALPVKHQQGVGCINNDEVSHADSSYQTVIALDVAIGGVPPCQTSCRPTTIAEDPQRSAIYE